MASIRVVMGKRLRELRLAQGLSQAMLARRADIDQRDISSYENGRAFPRADRLDDILKALSTTAEALLGTGQGSTRFGAMSSLAIKAARLIEHGEAADPEFASRVVRAMRVLLR